MRYTSRTEIILNNELAMVNNITSNKSVEYEWTKRQS